MNRDGRLALVILTPVLFSAVFSLARFVAEGFDVPREEDYQAAAALLEQQHFSLADKDAVAVLPAWSLRGHVHLRGRAPIPADVVDAHTPGRYRRIYLWVEPDAENELAKWLSVLPPPQLDEMAGRIRVLGFDLGSPLARFDFRERIGEGEVWVLDESKGSSVRCDQARVEGWACPGRPPWQRVTREWSLATENGVDALWVHPPKAGETLKLQWSGVPIGARLILQSGHTRKGAEKAKAAVDIEVWVAGEKAASVARSPEFSYRTEIIDTSKWNGGNHDVTFRFSSTNNGSNHFVFDAWTARERPAGGDE